MQKISQTQLKLAKQLLDDGAVIAVPTETVYGLAAKFGHPSAVTKLLRIKDRKAKNDDKFLALMLPSVAELKNYARLSPLAIKIAQRHFPGELTMILPKTPLAFKQDYCARIEMGIRIPDHEYMLKLLKITGPLLVTSANLRGEPPCQTSVEIEKQLPAIGVVITGKAGGSLPSTVISIEGDKLTTLRQGTLVF